MKELINKLNRPPEELWEQAIIKHYLMRLSWLDIITDMHGYDKAYEIHEKVWKDFLIDDAKKQLKELNITERDTRAAAQILTLQGSVLYRMLSEIVEFSPKRTEVRIFKCPIMELGKKEGWLDKVQKCPSCTLWWSWVAKEINPKIEYERTQTLSAGDPVCRKVLTLKE